MHTLKRISRILTALIMATMLLPWNSGSLSRVARAACPVTAENWHEVGPDSACAGGISDSNGNPYDVSMAIAPDGTVYVVWEDNSSGNYEIYTLCWKGSNWEEVGADSATGGGISKNSGDSRYPHATVAPDSTFYVTWYDNSSGNREIYVRRWNGTIWEEVGTGSASGGGISKNSGVSWFPSIAIALDGTPYVTWSDDSDGNDYEIYVRRWNGTIWEEVGTGSATWGGISNNNYGSSQPSIAIASDGTPYVAWYDWSYYQPEIYIRRWSGSGWEEVGAGSASGGGLSDSVVFDSLNPSVAIALDDTPYVVWEEYTIGGGMEIHILHWNGSGWEEVGTGSASDGGISDNSGHSKYPSTAVAPDGTLYVAWYDDSSGNQEIYILRWNGSSWEEVGFGSAIDGGLSDNSGASKRPSVAIASDGTPYVAWYDDSSGNREIYVRRWEGGGVQPDIGFRPNPDGYKFPNYRSFYPLPPADGDYTTADMRQMFGDDCVCRMVESVCFVKWHAIRWNIQANQSMNSGHCDGVASTSLRFFKGLDTPSDLQGGANATHDLDLGNARRHIAYYFVEQLTDPVKAYKEQVRQNTPMVILDQLHLAILGPDPTTLFVRQAGQGGHAITPYAIEDRGNGVYWVRVYDNNHPDDANRHVEINTTNDTWSYDLGETTWTGDANTHTLGIVPISEYAEEPVCPEWHAAADELAVWLSGEGHMLITDSQGRSIGYVGDQFVNEVPSAYESIVDGGLGVEMEPIYTLPLTETYTILLDGQTLTQTETVEVTQFGPGYAVWVDDVTLEPTSQDELVIAPDGTQLAYQPNDVKEVTLTLALDSTSESNQLQVNGADIGAGQIVTLTADVDNGQLVFNNAQAGGGEYDLEISRISAAGEQKFAHAGLAISAIDTHYVDYGAWDGSGPMTLHIDHGSDGTIDETLVLDNQAGRIYLPIITKNH